MSENVNGQEWSIRIARTGRLLAARAAMAQSLGARMKGLLGRRSLGAQEALILPQCRSIHTVGMRFPIDAVFVDRAWRVVALRPHLRQGRLVWPVAGAWNVVECADGTLERVDLAIGDELQCIPAA